MNNYSAKDIKEQVSIIELLARLGFHPARWTGNEQVYHSMLRDSDTVPSFTVNINLNVWYDHGLGIGGNIIDFGLRYWPGLSFPEVLEKISEIAAMAVPIARENLDGTARRRRAVKIPHYKIEEIKELGNNPIITAYLQKRGIYQQAKTHLKEIYYFVEDGKKQRKHFFAAGWKNEIGSWEVRNQHFKGCLGHKALTFIPGNPERLAVFEGFINYLSWLTEHPCATESILVLNTITLVFAATKKAGEFRQVSIYFDRDTIGHSATGDFIKYLPQAIDQSSAYEGYNDYNDKVVAALKSTPITNTGLQTTYR